MRDIIFKQFQEAKDAVYDGNDKEFNLMFIYYGSLISMITNDVEKNKPINIYSCLYEYPNIMNIFIEITGLNDFYELVNKMIIYFPSVSRSKLIRKKIKKIKNKLDKKNKGK